MTLALVIVHRAGDLTQGREGDVHAAGFEHSAPRRLQQQFLLRGASARDLGPPERSSSDNVLWPARPPC